MTLAHSSLLDPSPRLTESQLLEELRQSLYSWVLHNSHSSRVVVRSAVARPCLLPGSASPHRLYGRLPDSSLWQICLTLLRCLLMSTMWLVALVWCPTSINSCKCCRVRAFLRKKHEPPPLTPVMEDHMNQEVQPRSMTRGTVPNGPCTAIALETSRQQFSLSADSRKAFI